MLKQLVSVLGVSIKIWSGLLQLSWLVYPGTRVSGGNQANAIYLEMERLGFAVWYDNRASDLTKEGMREGIVQAAAFLLFLSDGVLERPFCESVMRIW